MAVPLIFERSHPGRRGVAVPTPTGIAGQLADWVPAAFRRQSDLGLPEVTEEDVVRHYTYLSHLNYGVDTGFYPLGSCTMKYNPKVNDWAAGLPGFADVHPDQPPSTIPGLLFLLAELERALAEVTGMDAVSLQPAAGAHGELTGILMIRAYLAAQGDHRTTVLVPDSAHGTNPATAAMAGYQVREIPSNRRGRVDLAALRQQMDGSVAALMLTNPNTLGLFEDEVLEIAETVHQAGGLLYYDGANANAILGRVRPGDMGFDVVHLNLHKTFATPHGGGGPGAGPVAVKKALEPFLPLPRLVGNAETGWQWDYDRPQSIGRVRSYYGNIGVLVRAYAYLRSQGAEGLKQVAETAVLHANYLLSQVGQDYHSPFPGPVKHEFVLSLTEQKRRGARALDVAKRLIDFGMYPPTVYFPLVVEEALMVEPTETESREMIDRFADALKQINREIDENPALLHEAPHDTIVSRLDEARAARHPVLGWPQLKAEEASRS